ncbi:hypothetical protein GOM49_07260 [Clostridium bovifaecis]|uniref:DUF3794 domain-containing protein n=1 Tax=Clostridium bovifaecis TaxID=2184719 RepID=A0A6I6F0X7_9CLOT|nr:hypothetical protein GOM49_07260 [Clostridium bovifaecis]
MSKKHKHNCDHKYEEKQEDTIQNLGPEQRLLAIMLILNALLKKIKTNNMEIKNDLIEVPLVNVDSEKQHKTSDTYESKDKSCDVDGIEGIEDLEDIKDIKDIEGIYNISTIDDKDAAEDYKEIVIEENINRLEDTACEVMPRSKVTSCKATVLQCKPSETLESYFPFKLGVTKIPIILSQFDMQVFIETSVNFPEPVFQVKDLEKTIFLNKCKLIFDANKLFINGLIREEIEYATARTIKENIISGDIKKSTFSIPFQCSTKVCFRTQPLVTKHSSILELEVINPNTNDIGIEEKNYEYFEFFNEKILCKIDSTEIAEIDNKEDIKLLKNTLGESQTFEKMTKKMIVTLGISLIQEQKVFIK